MNGNYLKVGSILWAIAIGGIGAPELHHWHHDRNRESGNYANVSPLMDLLFGTYRCPNHEPGEFGIEDAMPEGYLGQLAYPFIGAPVRAKRGEVEPISPPLRNTPREFS